MLTNSSLLEIDVPGCYDINNGKQDREYGGHCDGVAKPSMFYTEGYSEVLRYRY